LPLWQKITPFFDFIFRYSVGVNSQGVLSYQHMPSPHLYNYLRSNRKRLDFTQDEVAFLLGARGGTKVCRYERFARAPSLETAMAYEVIFQKPISEIFPGLFKRIEREVAARAKAMSYRTDLRKSTPKASRKLRIVTSIASGKINNDKINE
jgi:transcriptional regulator with XRE-family HTH domain